MPLSQWEHTAKIKTMWYTVCGEFIFHFVQAKGDRVPSQTPGGAAAKKQADKKAADKRGDTCDLQFLTQPIVKINVVAIFLPVHL